MAKHFDMGKSIREPNDIEIGFSLPVDPIEEEIAQAINDKIKAGKQLKRIAEKLVRGPIRTEHFDELVAAIKAAEKAGL